MLTDAKITANQANAQLSTGPKTEAGKAISSRNALRHGLFATAGLLPGEDPEEHNALLQGILKDYAPANSTETSLVYEIFDYQWRLRRAARYEATILSADIPDFKALNNMSLHAARLKRQFSATLKELEVMQTANRAARRAQLERAAVINQADRILDRPSTLADHGFDFTLETLERWRARDEWFDHAKMIIEDAKAAEDARLTDEDDDEDNDLDEAA